MNHLRHHLDTYLAVRRALGYKLEGPDALLRAFVDYAEEQQASSVTAELAVAWATLPTNASPQTWSRRLGTVRGFAQHLNSSDPLHEVPAADLLPYRQTRKSPYLYSDADITALLGAAQELAQPLRAATYTTLFGLLAVTGMRMGEAIALDRSDVDWDDAILLVRNTKFGKSRELPLHFTTMEALRTYSDNRDEAFPRLRTPSFFVSLAGTRLINKNVHFTFLQIIQKAGLSERRPRRPRIHDLRHSFAVKTVQGWYRAGLDVERQLPYLSTYLGHVSPATTYWYLTAAPELMGLAAERLERSMGVLP